MKFLVCILVTLGVAYGAQLPTKADCRNTFCTMDLKICPDGRPAPVPAGGCCPSLSACKTDVSPIKPNNNCLFTMCTMVFLTCSDGTPAPVAPGECCPSLKACKTPIGRRSLPGSSIISGNNLLQLLSGATQGTNLGTALSILKLVNNLQQFSNDIHQIPLLVNQTIAGLLNGTGQVSQVVIDQLINTVNHQSASRDLLGGLVQNANLLSSVSHLLPPGTSIQTVIAILKLLSNVNQLSNDVHQIPVLLNQTLASLVGGAGEASQVVVQQLLALVGASAGPQPGKRDLLSGLGQNANLLSSVSHLLPQGTSISTVLSLLSLLNNVNNLNNDLHQIPAVLQQTIQGLLNGVQNILPPTIQPVQGA